MIPTSSLSLCLSVSLSLCLSVSLSLCLSVFAPHSPHTLTACDRDHINRAKVTRNADSFFMLLQKVICELNESKAAKHKSGATLAAIARAIRTWQEHYHSWSCEWRKVSTGRARRARARWGWGKEVRVC